MSDLDAFEPGTGRPPQAGHDNPPAAGVWLVSVTDDATLAWHALRPDTLPATWPEGFYDPPADGRPWPTIAAVAMCGHRDRYHHRDDRGLFGGLRRCGGCCQATGVPDGTGRPATATPPR